MSRLLLAALIALGFSVPTLGATGEADAQVWKVKRGKAKAKASAKRSTSDRARPKKKASSSSSRSRKQRVELVPDEDEPPPTRGGDERTDEGLPPAKIKVEEVFD